MTSISTNLLIKFKKKALEVTNKNIKAELADPMSLDYYKGYRHGLSDSPVFVCQEAIELLYEALNHIDNHNIQDKVAKFLRGE